MATKAAFTDAEWQVLQWAVADTVTYLSMADPGLWDTFKETSKAVKYIADMRTASESLLVRELAADAHTRRDKDLSGDPAAVADEVTGRISLAVSILKGKAPDDLDAFREFIMGVGKATAEAAHGMGPAEEAALTKLGAAMA